MITDEVPPEAEGRGLRVKKLDMYPVECVVRGYITGSGWKEYGKTGEVCGIPLPEGLQESQKLPEPIFTPATKAEVGDHDENIDFERAVEIIGDRAPDGEPSRHLDRALRARRATTLLEKGIIIADTKFEFGASPGAEVVLGDEVLTPDSSRFWPADDYEAGRGQSSFDKQYVRDWLDESGLGPLASRPRAARRDRPGHPRQVRRGVRAHHRPRLLGINRSAGEGKVARVPPQTASGTNGLD